MKKFLVLLLFLSQQCFSQNYIDFINQAMKAYSNRNFGLSCEYFEKAFKIEALNKHHLYNAAVVASLNKNKEKAFEYLQMSIKQGWDDPVEIIQNDSFSYLYPFDEWKTNFAEIESKINKKLQKRLLIIYDNDQKIIRKILSTNPNIVNYKTVYDSLTIIRDSIQNSHLQIITTVLDSLGFVSKYIVGKKASQVTFLVIQHSNLKTQKKYYSLFKNAAENGLFEKRLFALLEDRILVLEKKQQLYGTQLFYEKSDSTYHFYPISEINSLSQRRISMGLKSIEEYAVEYGIEWSLNSYLGNLKKSKKALKKGVENKFIR
jgi:hypothetical protein